MDDDDDESDDPPPLKRSVHSSPASAKYALVRGELRREKFLRSAKRASRAVRGALSPKGFRRSAKYVASEENYEVCEASPARRPLGAVTSATVAPWMNE